jgi:hypothetical protein
MARGVEFLGGVHLMAMETLPNWDEDPISVICAPVSATLITRPMQWYGVTNEWAQPGFRRNSPAQRLKAAEKTRRWRAKNKTTL